MIQNLKPALVSSEEYRKIGGFQNADFLAIVKHMGSGLGIFRHKFASFISFIH